MANKGKKFPGQVLTRDEVDLLLGSFSDTRAGVRDRAIVAIGLYASLRCHEILSLEPGDLDLQSGSVLVRCGKGGKSARVGINAAAVQYVQAWLDIRPDSPWLFCNQRGGRLTTAYVRKFIKQQADYVGITHRVHPHALRHTSAVSLMNAGLSLVVISRQLRHSNLITTNTYLQHVNPHEVIDSVHSARF